MCNADVLLIPWARSFSLTDSEVIRWRYSSNLSPDWPKPFTLEAVDSHPDEALPVPKLLRRKLTACVAGQLFSYDEKAIMRREIENGRIG